MSLLDLIFKSPIVANIALVIGVLASLGTIFARIFPDPVLTRRIALSTLTVVILFFIYMLFGAVGVIGFLTIVFLLLALWLFERVNSKLDKIVNSQPVDHQPIHPVELEHREIQLLDGMTAESADAERSYQHQAQRYGIGYGTLDVSCFLKDDGSARIRRKLTVEAYSRIDGLETSLMIPATSEPGSWDEANRPRVEPVSGGYFVSLSGFKRVGNKQFAQIVFAPELNAGKTLDVILEENLYSGIFAMGLSANDVDKLKERDYFGWNIDRPTRVLRLKVYFPGRMQPEVFGTVVQYNIAFSDMQTARYQYEEQKRLKEPSWSRSDADSRWVLSLDIDYPMVGLIYMLHWLPIPREEWAQEM